jgi:hypothetical protein
MMRRAAIIVLCGAGLLAPAGARASGGPVLTLFGGHGVSAVGSPLNLVTVLAGRSTVVEGVRRSDGAVENYASIRGQFGIPGAGFDGSATGLSANGRTLVLASAAYGIGARRTELAVLDARRMRERARIVLRGSFAVDAISPDGRWLYLTHYLSQTNFASYEVRAYDVIRRRLLAQPLVDPRDPGEKMQGLAVTRAMSADGRWAYTLYGATRTPFVHALDTAHRRAFCLDLPMLNADSAMSARLSVGGGALRVELNGAPVALVDPATLAVTRPLLARPLLAGPPFAEIA